MEWRRLARSQFTNILFKKVNTQSEWLKWEWFHFNCNCFLLAGSDYFNRPFYAFLISHKLTADSFWKKYNTSSADRHSAVIDDVIVQPSFWYFFALALSLPVTATTKQINNFYFWIFAYMSWCFKKFKFFNDV